MEAQKHKANGKAPVSRKTTTTGLRFERRLSRPDVAPFDMLEWDRRDAVITNEKGEKVFEQNGVEIPRPWSQMATNVVVSKYFRGTPGTPERESSVRQLVGRVVNTIGEWGRKGGYFATKADAKVFEDELALLVLQQYGSFNSPVWFNVGVDTQPQCSACFINSVEDSMHSILQLAHTEAMLFKFGSGTGSNLSALRSSRERLRGGGTASGPVSFMRGFDAFAGVIKSGGRTRRAAKMVILDAVHPDVLEFIDCKAHEERKAWALIEAGYDGSFGGEAYGSVFFQNSNNSVRVTDEFMRAVESDGEWRTRAITTGEVVDTYRAREVMKRICDAAWLCGDPGLQFDSTINDWHTCPVSGRINASNPCSEYMFLDDTACNLASLNLTRFQREDGTFDVAMFRHAVAVFITAQEILVSNAGYPTERIGQNSERYRPLGLGYANLGALLMSLGLPYDSEAGRACAGALTALMGGEAYRQSARLAAAVGPFEGFAPNRVPMLRVIGKHHAAAEALPDSLVPAELLEPAREAWRMAEADGKAFGFRNSQVTVLAPTGTIAFMMDCDTTGVEPDIALVKYKRLSGGGMLKIVNRTVPLALRRLGYDAAAQRTIVEYVDEHDTIEGAPALKDEHLAVFDCAFRPVNGRRSIHYMGHVRMMAATQPFLSGAISKTVNLPEGATQKDVEDIYLAGWRLGLKAMAIYRDGCKRTQPLSTAKTEARSGLIRGGAAAAAPGQAGVATAEPKPIRRRLSPERHAITHKFSIGGHEGYITVGMFEDGTPGEVFIVMSKEGSTVSGLMDAFATAISLTLQYGVPLHVLVDKFSHTRYEPSGFTGNPDVPIAKSITDYLFRWLAAKFLKPQNLAPMPAGAPSLGGASTPLPMLASPASAAPPDGAGELTFEAQLDAPPCSECGSLMVRSGACYRCLVCGSTSGCS